MPGGNVLSSDVPASEASPEQQHPHVPSRLQCPITLCLFREPVVIDSGHTFERAALLETWRTKPGLCPLTGLVLKNRQLSPNLIVREQVQEWLEANPGVVPQGWSSAELPKVSEPERQADVQETARRYARRLYQEEADATRDPLPSIAQIDAAMQAVTRGSPADLLFVSSFLQDFMVGETEPYAPTAARPRLSDTPLQLALLAASFFFLLHHYNIIVAALLPALIAVLMHFSLYIPDPLPPPPLGPPSFCSIGAVLVARAVTLVLLLLLRFLQCTLNRLVWGTPPMQMPWRFVGAWALCLAGLCGERFRHGNRLSSRGRSRLEQRRILAEQYRQAVRVRGWLS